MFTTAQHKLSIRFALLALILSLLVPSALNTTPAYAKDGDTITFGIVQAMPADGVLGTWTIGGLTYTITPATTFDTTSGRIAVGACVRVKMRSKYYQPGVYVAAINGQSMKKCR